MTEENGASATHHKSPLVDARLRAYLEIQNRNARSSDQPRNTARPTQRDERVTQAGNLIRELQMVSFANRGDLFEVVPAVNQLEHPPLIGAEGTEDTVSSTPVVAEEYFGVAADSVETCEVLRRSLREFVP